jgi:hypothetical protein
MNTFTLVQSTLIGVDAAAPRKKQSRERCLLQVADAW